MSDTIARELLGQVAEGHEGEVHSGHDDEAEVLRKANDTEYGLAAYVCTSDPDRAKRVAAGLSFGHVGINTGMSPTPELPFGGMKQSGYGREGGVEGLLEFCEVQTIVRS